MSESAERMAVLRQGWTGLGFSSVNLFVPNEQQEMLKAQVNVSNGEFLIKNMHKFTQDQLHMLGDKKHGKVPDYTDLAMLDRSLNDSTPKIRQRFDEYRTLHEDYRAQYSRVLKLDYSDVKDILYASAENYAKSLVLAGKWVQLREWYGEI